MKTAELEGAALDLAVAKAAGRSDVDVVGSSEGPVVIDGRNKPYAPSTDWAIGGPLIESEGIVVVRMHRVSEQGDFEPAWFAWVLDADQGAGAYFDVVPYDADGEGPTYLIAGMRAYVASKLGEEVELP